MRSQRIETTNTFARRWRRLEKKMRIGSTQQNNRGDVWLAFQTGATSLMKLQQSTKRKLLRGALLAVLVACCTMNVSASEFASNGDADLWQALRTRTAFVLLRHAIAPGTGDPDHFLLDDCSTQRNLSAVGRKQAAALGEQFRKNGIQAARVFSSRWCRCLETAELLKLGSVEKLPELDSFFQQYERRDSQTERLRVWISHQKFNQPAVLVTHQVNITALTGFYPSSGELVFAKRSVSGEISFLGSIKTEGGR